MTISLLLTEEVFEQLMEYLDDYASVLIDEYSATETEKEVRAFMDKLNQLKTKVKLE